MPIIAIIESHETVKNENKNHSKKNNYKTISIRKNRIDRFNGPILFVRSKELLSSACISKFFDKLVASWYIFL